MVASIHQARGDTPTSHNQALEDYLDFCQEDPAIQQVMQIEGLSRDDLKQLHARLLTAGLGRWVNGHNMALSTLAYTEPLQFAVRAPKIGMPWAGVVMSLVDYWEERVSQGSLLRQLR